MNRRLRRCKNSIKESIGLNTADIFWELDCHQILFSFVHYFHLIITFFFVVMARRCPPPKCACFNLTPHLTEYVGDRHPLLLMTASLITSHHTEAVTERKTMAPPKVFLGGGGSDKKSYCDREKVVLLLLVILYSGKVTRGAVRALGKWRKKNVSLAAAVTHRSQWASQTKSGSRLR